jgi:hypothetical protein
MNRSQSGTPELLRDFGCLHAEKMIPKNRDQPAYAKPLLKSSPPR